MTTAYVLKLESSKIYIGYKGLEEQQKENCAWTQKYKPLQVLHKIQTTHSSHIDVIVKDYMLKYGIDNVRGGSYTVLDSYTYNELCTEFSSPEPDFANEKYNAYNSKGYESSYEDGYDSV
jgi:hypothetical protein